MGLASEDGDVGVSLWRSMNLMMSEATSTP